MVQNHRKVLKDAQTTKIHRGLYPGVTGEIGAERFLKVLPSTSIEVNLASHFVFAVRDEQFPSGFNSNLAAAALRVGTNYYFNLDRQRRKQPESTLPGIAR
jgi:hypothetical protein